MKRFWLGLLSLGLIIAFSAPAFAVQPTFSGNWYIKGWYNKDAALMDKDAPNSTTFGRGSSAWYSTRTRIGMTFPVAKGLTFITRFDALERKWFGYRNATNFANVYSNLTNEHENIGWDLAFVSFATPIGMFTVGDAGGGCPFGTIMSDAPCGEGASAGTIAWGLPIGPVTLGLSAKKSNENANNLAGQGLDNDSNVYYLTLTTKWSTGGAGFMSSNVWSRTANVGATPTKTTIPSYTIYVLNKFGKLYFEMETGMSTGYYREYANVTPAGAYDLKFSSPFSPSSAISSYWNLEADLAPFKVGGRFWWSNGDKTSTPEKMEGGSRVILDLDAGVNFMMILFNYDYYKQFGKLIGNVPAAAGLNANLPSAQTAYWMQNLWFYQVYGSFALSPKLAFDAAFAYAYADELPTHNGKPVSQGGVEFVSDKFGSELDVSMTYKIFDNLSYTIAAAYLWTGDYYKGTDPNAKIANNYLITNKLYLTF